MSYNPKGGEQGKELKFFTLFGENGLGIKPHLHDRKFLARLG